MLAHLASALLFLVPGAPQRNPVFSGIVSEVVDGDTIKIRLEDKSEITLDLWGSDAPEAGQPFGPEATKQLSKLALNREVIVEYYRPVGEVYVNLPGRQVLANEWMIANGYAWWHKLPKEGEPWGLAKRYIKA